MTLRVVGAGLGRTGTASLKVALEQLGLDKCYHMGEVMMNQHHIPLWVAAADGRPDWDTIFRGYGAAVDYPACSFWQELMDYFPDSKVVLSTRDPDSWFSSVHETILSPDFTAFLEQSPMADFFHKTVWKDYKPHINDRDFMVNYFRAREDHIKATVPADRLLVFRAEEGWAPLCNFLGVPVPDAPYPRVNSREETRQLVENLTRSGSNYEQALVEESGRLFESKF